MKVPMHYKVLGVAPGTSADELHKKYKLLAMVHHPDAGGDTTRFAEITEAYAVLKDPARRAEYDGLLKLTQKPCSNCEGSGKVSYTKGFTKRSEKPCSRCNGEGYV